MKIYFSSKKYAEDMMKKIKQDDEDLDKIMDKHIYGKWGEYGIPLILSLSFTICCYVLIWLGASVSSLTSIIVRSIIVTICGIFIFFKSAV